MQSWRDHAKTDAAITVEQRGVSSGTAPTGRCLDLLVLSLGLSSLVVLQ